MKNVDKIKQIKMGKRKDQNGVMKQLNRIAGGIENGTLKNKNYNNNSLEFAQLEEF